MDSTHVPPSSLTHIHPTTTDYTKLTQLVMSPIPELQQVRANRGILESSIMLRGCNKQMRESVKCLTFEEIQAAKKGGVAVARPQDGSGDPTPVYLKNTDSEK